MEGGFAGNSGLTKVKPSPSCSKVSYLTMWRTAGFVAGTPTVVPGPVGATAAHCCRRHRNSADTSALRPGKRGSEPLNTKWPQRASMMDVDVGWAYRSNEQMETARSSGGVVMKEQKTQRNPWCRSPLMQLKMNPKEQHPNIHTDAMFSPRAVDALVHPIAKAATRRVVNSQPEEVFEPLDHVHPGLPPALIHVSRSAVLPDDARRAARRLAAADVPSLAAADWRVYPGSHT
jgi:hypothetical protein